MKEISLIDEFLNYLKFERHFSPHTAKCYAADLAQFCSFLVGHVAAAGGHQNFTERAGIRSMALRVPTAQPKAASPSSRLARSRSSATPRRTR